MLPRRHANTSQSPPLEDYANKAWGGLVAHYYGGRVRCYEDHFGDAGAYAACVDGLARAFQADHARVEFPLCASSDATAAAVSARLLAKYFP